MISLHESLFRLHASPELSFSIFVDKTHPDAEKLAKAAGVSMERLDRPIFVYYRDHHLVQRAELDAAFKDVPGYEPFVGGPPHSEQKFIADRSWWYENWKGYLQTPFAWAPTEQGVEKPIEEKSTIALSTGPHWSTRELWPKGAVEQKGSEDLIMRGYQGAVSRIAMDDLTSASSLYGRSLVLSSAEQHYGSFEDAQSARMVEEQYSRGCRLLAVR
ncbi:hypothetical protein QFC19_003536 [Naganishia cerealis]|uniref:Uncharacterized protein n=1 Tax=Naganishia cerealis TaxID=610337 RepID=A0ACC2W2U4_9TREE|nr:hypothetical protein QFC19_003536 [Naganishia cerealis]